MTLKDSEDQNKLDILGTGERFINTKNIFI